VSSLVSAMIGDGLMVETSDRGQPHKGGSGRPSTLLALAVPPGAIVGVDLGHRHIRVAVADRAANVIAESEQQFDVDNDGPTALDITTAMMTSLISEAGLDISSVVGVGVGVPGPINRETGRLSSAILPGWRGLTPAAELGERTGLPVVADNDSNVGALGELHHGAARGLHDVVYVKVAGGVGAGIILGGRLHRGTTGIAGEIGHVQVREDGPVCRCGSRGCLETQAAAPRLLALLQPAYDHELTVASMLELEEQGDSGVTRVVNDAGRVIGRALADLCNHLNPETIVVGGSLVGSTALLRGIRDSVDRFAQPQAADAVSVIAAELGPRAELMGALSLAIARYAVHD